MFRLLILPLLAAPAFAADAPDVSISLGKRTAKGVPERVKCTRTGGGNIDVQQPSPDTLVITMTGVAVAYGSPAGSASAVLDFDLSQAFDVSFDKPGVKAAKLTVEARVIGFLRCPKTGSAEECGAASVTAPEWAGVSIAAPSHSVCAGQSLSINDQEGPQSGIVGAGSYCLTQTFKVVATQPKCLFPCAAPSAEFAPDPALDPLWISAKEPFKGAKKADLGFRVTVKVSPQDVPEPKK